MTWLVRRSKAPGRKRYFTGFCIASSRISADRAWAGNPSARASATVWGPSTAKDFSSQRTSEVRLRKS